MSSNWIQVTRVLGVLPATVSLLKDHNLHTSIFCLSYSSNIQFYLQSLLDINILSCQYHQASSVFEGTVVLFVLLSKRLRNIREISSLPKTIQYLQPLSVIGNQDQGRKRDMLRATAVEKKYIKE